MNACSVDDGGELGMLIKIGLMLAPGVAVAPVGGQLLEVAERHPAAPADPGELVGPAGTGQAVAQVVQVGLGHIDPERSDVGHVVPSCMARQGQNGMFCSSIVEQNSPFKYAGN